MTHTKSLLSVASALLLTAGAAFAGGPELPLSSLETTDAAYFAQSEPMMTDPLTMADVYYIVPMEVVEVEEIWLVPSIDSEMPQG